ncbi:MAG: NTP transferase domain-containing protein, partial [Candidatus Gribaldobacteria bacterium]|nr:NTP transferase domain-containing protein [Candidatus Gribaldobacteria bacterium]
MTQEKNKMVQVVILAGGKGSRMNSEYSKVLHVLEEKPIIWHLLETVTKVCAKPTLIVGYQGEKVIEATNQQCHYVWQKEQLGTGHAVLQAKADLMEMGFAGILVLYGDHPFVAEKTLRDLIKCFEQSDENTALCMATFTVPNYEDYYSVFYNYGRIIRNDQGKIVGTVEFKDATDEQKAICEVNLGYYCFKADWLWDNISKLENKNNAKEYYLTDLMKLASEQGKSIHSIEISQAI